MMNTCCAGGAKEVSARPVQGKKNYAQGDECERKCRAALYCRLSKDDEQIGESTSIATQRIMLLGFCEENQWDVVDIYIDDGYSGLTYNRPGFSRMIDDVENGRVDVVVTKDLSRLGRDYIMTGYLTDVYFAQTGIRYIAINDGIDTQRHNNDIAPFKNIMNDMYAKDISRKIKTAKRQRAYKGMYIAAQAPYGYLVDPQEHSRLIIDDAVAENIRWIFSRALEYRTLDEIARELTERRIITPAIYKAMRGEARFATYLEKKTDHERFVWNRTTVDKILHDAVYIGHMVNHKYEVVSYKTKVMRRVPKEERIVVENTHEAIVSKDVFDKVQEILKGRSRIHRHTFDNWLQDKVFCADCNRPLSLHTKVQKDGQLRPAFRCIRSYQKPGECTGYRTIDYDKVLTLIAERIGRANGDEEGATPELNRALVRQRVDAVWVGKRDESGKQDVKIVLRDMNRNKHRKIGLAFIRGD